MADFLLEIGLEEMPARMIAPAQDELARRVLELLMRERLAGVGAVVQSYSTPRRLAVHAREVLSEQANIKEQLTGPSWKVAFKDGEPTPAALAFARKAGVEVGQLEKLTNAKGEYVSTTVKRQGKPAAEILSAYLAKEIGTIYWAKSMYWRAGKPERFVRPLRWIVALLDHAIVPVEFGGIHAGNVSYGHRVLHGDSGVTIEKPADYLPSLEKAHILADVEVRRERIRKALDAVTRTVPDARWREDVALVDTVTHLTEWPSVVLGGFEVEYLTLPEEVLVTVMRDHQKYFAVEDAEGRLAAHFLAVLNTESGKEGADIIRHGNERVLRARFNDARFFWGVDQKIPLLDRVEMLKAVTFQKDLGSYYAKTEGNLRVASALADEVATAGTTVDKKALLAAVRLAKTDLTAELVKEFTELQGVVGGLYARAQGLGETVASAIYSQYTPASADDAIPATVEGQLLGLADRLNTIVDMFAIGLEPTGSKDPFALRRAANGVIKILAESALPLSLSAIQRMAIENSCQVGAASAAEVVSKFFRERIEFYLREVQGFAYDVVNAVLAAASDSVPDAIARAHALAAVRDISADGYSDFLAISAAFKRIKNILRQAKEKGEVFDGKVKDELLTDAAELALYRQTVKMEPEVERLRASQLYGEALERIATLRPFVDLFFDTVMVMAPEAEIRANRLAFIRAILESFSRIADFSEIVS
jgi:glycyl-tRNA synthetase beta chain